MLLGRERIDAAPAGRSLPEAPPSTAAGPGSASGTWTGEIILEAVAPAGLVPAEMAPDEPEPDGIEPDGIERVRDVPVLVGSRAAQWWCAPSRTSVWEPNPA